ncbi:MAG: hypothetical protein SFW67_11810 [Myxococcaceae bacterium]|nr:hypothetical protein [Myxococcaceae bacterium]
MSRKYEPNPKHKWPKGFGSLCPKKLDLTEAQTLLDRAVSVATVSTTKLWSVQGEWCFCAHPSGEDVWHGFPVVGAEVDERVWKALEQAGLVTKAVRRKLAKQRTLPGDWP